MQGDRGQYAREARDLLRGTGRWCLARLFDMEAPMRPISFPGATAGLALLWTLVVIGSPGPAAAAPPTIVPIPDQAMTEDSARAVPFTVGDPDTPLTALTVTATSSNATLLPASGILLSGSGALRTVTLRPAANRWGSASITVRVGDGLSVSGDTFVVTVASVNDPPFFTGTPPSRCAAGSAFAAQVITADADPGDTRTVSCITKPAWLAFTATGNGTAILAGTPSANDAGVNPVRLKVVDRAGAVAYGSLAITVTATAAATPRFTPLGGTYREPLPVTISTPTSGATIRFTTDGTTPTATTGSAYLAPLKISSHTVLTAVAFKTGMQPSSAARAVYRFPPGAATGGLAALGIENATLAGTVHPKGSATSAWFEWGSDPTLSTFSTTPPLLFGALTSAQAMTADLSGLAPGSTYYFRLVARNAAGTTRGAIDYFTPQQPGFGSLLVNSTGDQLYPPLGKMTLRAAVHLLDSGGVILFDNALNGRTINLLSVGERHSVLKGEVFTFAPGVGWQFQGYLLRDYGRSAMYAAKNVTIDASALAAGITLTWAGAEPARIMAVYGDLIMTNVTVTGGRAVSEPTTAPDPDDPPQPHTLARGGAMAVWGMAAFTRCTFGGNRAEGDLNPSRDRGAFGGAIYADTLLMDGCVVSGNQVTGFGAAGGGVYTVAGAETSINYSELLSSTVSGNRVTGQHAYGGGVYSDGGGPGSLNYLTLRNCTVARNLVEDHPGLPQSSMMQYYYRGGGIYMSNGYLELIGSTVAENRVTGIPFAFSGKPNMGGGGIAATIGNAHVVEAMYVWHSIVAGNTLNGADEDIFTGSLLDFYSFGYNRFGVIDFSHILVPVPSWWCLSRRHYPKVGDAEDVSLDQVVDVAGAAFHGSIVSVGADEGGPALLWYPPAGSALDQVPLEIYDIPYVWSGYQLIDPGIPDDFANLLLADLRVKYADTLGSDFGLEFGDLTGLTFYPDAFVWPADPLNAPWIKFWHDLDTAIGDRLGDVHLGDDYWGSFPDGYSLFGENIDLMTYHWSNTLPYLNDFDQLGQSRFESGPADIGAVEIP
jgi:hypothetical protein